MKIELPYKKGDVVIDFTIKKIVKIGDKPYFVETGEAKQGRKSPVYMVHRLPIELELYFLKLNIKEISFNDFEKKTGIVIDARSTNKVKYKMPIVENKKQSDDYMLIVQQLNDRIIMLEEKQKLKDIEFDSLKNRLIFSELSMKNHFDFYKCFIDAVTIGAKIASDPLAFGIQEKPLKK